MKLSIDSRALAAASVAFAAAFATFVSSPVQAADNSTAVMISNGFHFDEKGGEALYRAVCQSCHMANGQGASGAGAYPALAANPRLAAATYPVYNIVHGKKSMPPFGKMLTDEQIADVTNYVRTHMGNNYTDAVTPEAVKAVR